MKLKAILMIVSIILLTACSMKTSPTDAGNQPLIPVTGEKNVTIDNYAFSPADLTVKVGTTVTWTNKDAAGHNVIATDNSWGSSSLLKTGQSYRYTFTKAGTFPYHCGIHTEMKATITVVN